MNPLAKVVVLSAILSLSSFATAHAGGGKIQIMTSGGMYVLDTPTSGELSMQGLVHVSPFAADTVVSINGVNMIAAPGLAAGWFAIDPANQPQVVAGALSITASSASTRTSRTLTLPCAAPVQLSGNPAEGSSLAGVSSLSLSWSGALPQNGAVAQNLIGEGPLASLSSYSFESNTILNGLSSQSFDQSASGVSLSVSSTSGSGYVAQIRYPGVYQLDGNSGGHCGRIQRLFFVQ